MNFVACSFKCFTCLGANGCEICAGNSFRIGIPECKCMEGYYEIDG